MLSAFRSPVHLFRAITDSLCSAGMGDFAFLA
jgi:hypothetical protein